MQVSVTRWGSSLGLRIPKSIAGQFGLTEGARVEVEAEGDHIVVRVGRPRYTLDALLGGMTPEDMREVFEWTTDAGREAVD